MELDNGSHLLTQYVNDFCIREGVEEWRWTVQFLFRVDVPVTV